jgi:metal-responsive CopG/Arc/MetJ family transcriptional regulator
MKSTVISVRLFPEQIQKLDTLQQTLGATSRGEVIRKLIEREDFNPTGKEGEK